METIKFDSPIILDEGHFRLQSGEWLQSFTLPKVHVSVKKHVPHFRDGMDKLMHDIEELHSFDAVEAREGSTLYYEAIDNEKYKGEQVGEYKAVRLYEEDSAFILDVWSRGNGVHNCKVYQDENGVFWHEAKDFSYLSVEITIE